MEGLLKLLKCQRDILGFLLIKSQELESAIDMNEALKYSIGEVSHPLAHGDGEKRKTNKSGLYDSAISSTLAPRANNVEGSKVYVLLDLYLRKACNSNLGT